MMDAAGWDRRRRLVDAETTVDLNQLREGSSLGGRIEELRNSSVLIVTRTQRAAALALIELDGVARRIIIASPDLREAFIPSMIATGDVDTLVTDRVPGETCFSGVRDVSISEIQPVIARPVRDLTTEWVLMTSGTTGPPKMAVHTLSTLTGAFSPSGSGAQSAVWATFYDIRRYGGLQILLRALTGGGSMVLSDAHGGFHKFFARSAREGVTHISGTPTHWRSVLMGSAIKAISPRYIRLSGEAVDQTILSSLRVVFPDAVIVHAFASTEAGVAFDVDDGFSGFPADWLGRMDVGVQLEVRDGSLRIKSARTALRYLHDQDCLTDDTGFVDTGDMVERFGGRCQIMGRRTGIINVGGSKVHPEEVEAVINRHPMVHLSRVAGRRNSITGAIVVADIVLRPYPVQSGGMAKTQRLEDEILAACRDALPPHKVPTRIRFVSSIEIAASGKVVRAVG
jgi:acyl-coenzyme A synthetase/AMP-(fatty) acid ligase